MEERATKIRFWNSAFVREATKASIVKVNFMQKLFDWNGRVTNQKSLATAVNWLILLYAEIHFIDDATNMKFDKQEGYRRNRCKHS